MTNKVILFNNSSASFKAHRAGIFKSLQADGYDVNALLPETISFDSTDAYIQQKTILLPLSRKGINIFNELISVVRIYRILKKYDPEVIHNFTIKPVLYGTIAAKLAGIPKIVNTITGMGYVFTSDTVFARLLKPVLHVLYRIAFSSKNVAIIFQNPEDLQYFLDSKLITPDQSHLILGSGVDTNFYTPPAQQPSGDKIVITCVARLLREKGIFELAEATRLLSLEKIPDFEVRVIGAKDPNNPGTLTDAEIAELEKIPNFKLLGLQKNILSFLHQSHIFCLPSYREGVPMASLEAMACGLPVVTTNAPGCKETVIDGLNGLLVPAKESKALSDALKKMILHEDLRVSMGGASRKMALEKFSAQTIVKQIRNLYKV